MLMTPLAVETLFFIFYLIKSDKKQFPMNFGRRRAESASPDAVFGMKFHNIESVEISFLYHSCNFLKNFIETSSGEGKSCQENPYYRGNVSIKSAGSSCTLSPSLVSRHFSSCSREVIYMEAVSRLKLRSNLALTKRGGSNVGTPDQ